jgi:hypothetical protein
MGLVGLPFNQTFTFSRPGVAPVRGPDGALTIAAANTPRFDHSSEGEPLGLLVEPGDLMGQADRCRAIAGDWDNAAEATVLHEYLDPEGLLQRRAIYTIKVRATINALLSTVGHHRRVGAVPGYLKNAGGHVRFRDNDWQLPAAIATAANQVLEDAGGRVLVDG